MSLTYIGPAPDYCYCCYSDAAKAGRAVKEVAADLRLCQLCERRWREGLIHYRPSNGSEGMGFMSRCERCRHCKDDGESRPKHDYPHALCGWGILDKVMEQMWSSYESWVNWFNPLDMDDRGDCKRFTPKDYDRDDRDPVAPPDPNQMTFDDIDVPVERVPFSSPPASAERGGK